MESRPQQVTIDQKQIIFTEILDNLTLARMLGE